MKEYYITKKQLDSIEHYKNMFKFEANNVKELCSEERFDIVYGFELGKIYNHLIDCFTNMMTLESEISEQKL